MSDLNLKTGTSSRLLVLKENRPTRSQSRYIASDDILSKYNAEPLNQENLCNYSNHDDSSSEDYSKEFDIGIKVSSWCIATRTSTIAHEHEIETLTHNLEELANQRGIHEKICVVENVHDATLVKTRKRRLSLPESVYIHAHVHIYREDIPLKISFDVTAALSEWSKCHNHLSEDLPVYRGVSIIKSIDAPLWKKNYKIIPTDFNYDWTFSTPYSGTTCHVSHEESCWMPCDESGLDMTLLTDQSVPILYYDEIKLFEDDMHDNGYTSLTCKIRVMPTCLLCLMSLFVRVDYVLVRVKEVRIFTKFHEENSSSDCMTLWREISWRECRWNQLGQFGLPNHVQAWRLEDNTLTGKELQLHQQRIQTMIRKLPIVPLPPDLSNISYLNSRVVSIL